MRTLVIMVLDLVMPHGGQLQARRNAWAGMVENHATAAARREAERVINASRSA